MIRTSLTTALAATCLLGLAAGAALASEAAPAATAPAATSATPATQPAEVAFTTNERGLDRRNMDLTADPCVDFYQYANGGWLARNPIPADESSWGVSSEMRERNYVLLRSILDEAAAADDAAGSNQRKVGDFWTTAMDTAAIEKAGAAPLAQDLAAIAAIASPADAAAWARRQHATGAGVLFGLGVMQDLQDSDKYIVYATQGGLGLPDRDYYTKDDAESVALRAKYVDHVAAMLGLLGDEPAVARDAAERILALETRLAEASLTNLELRDPASYYNIQTVGAADAATPSFSWSALFREIGIDEKVDTFSYAHPKFFAAMDAALADVPLATWKDYFRWHLVDGAAAYLSSAFDEQNFDFYGRTLRGAESQRPRWKRMVDQTSGSLGEALGQVYVARAFPPATKERADDMIEDLRTAIHARISALDWMGDTTKTEALRKLDAFVSKIGYPDEWRDYSALEIGRESLLANVRAAVAFERRRDFDKLGQPIDRNEWGMSPQTINAYYNPLQTEIVFPAAIMQPPLFDGTIDDAVNYGGMGAIIGHEFMHGFDDQGSRFDAEGNMKSWWSDEDRQRFEERTQKLVDHYDSFVAVDDLHVNGQLTLGENIGDLAGITMAYYALQEALGDGERELIDGFTPEQRFFLSFAQAWRRAYRPEALKLQVHTNVHSPAMFRAVGPLAHMPEFAAAFGCEAGDPMVLPADERAEIW